MVVHNRHLFIQYSLFLVIGFVCCLCMTLDSHELFLEKSLLDLRKKKYLQGGELEEVFFYSQYESNSTQHLKRKGMLLKRPNAKATILVCHGYMCDKVDSGIFRMMFPHFNVMTFDFRAHGELVDENQYCTFGKDEAYDVIAAVERIKSDTDINHLPIIAYGFSMGAVASILAQSHTKNLFDAMVLDCPYDTSENVIRNAIKKMKFSVLGYEFNLPGQSILEGYAFNPYVQSLLKTLLKTVASLDAMSINTQISAVSPVESVRKVSVPCFFIHCKNDEKIPADAGKALYESAQGYKRLWLTEGDGHFRSFFHNPEKYVYKVNKFINTVLSGNFKHKQREKISVDYSTVSVVDNTKKKEVNAERSM